jgi:thioredoxin reductase (NADPH)
MLNNPIIFAIFIWLIIEATYFINKIVNKKTNWFKSDSDKNINIADGKKPKRMLISFTKTLKSKYNGNSGWRLYDDLTDDISYIVDGIDIDAHGYIKTNEYMQTTGIDVYAVGDIRNTVLRQIVTACSDGAIASTDAIKSLNKSK